jgi:glutamine amidotransferase
VIGIINYGIGNTGSILNMLKRVGTPAALVSTPEEVVGAHKLILPGVGAFGEGMRALARSGLLDSLRESVLERRKPVLGICLGMQLMGRGSEEGGAEGLGWIDADVVRFPAMPGLKVPHMGWNVVKPSHASVLLSDQDADARFYFVHSFHLRSADPDLVVGTAHHGYDFPAVVTRGNIGGTQFHPEKSHRFGLTLLRNFAERFGSS